jgi:hypothetical protein
LRLADAATHGGARSIRGSAVLGLLNVSEVYGADRSERSIEDGHTGDDDA